MFIYTEFSSRFECVNRDFLDWIELMSKDALHTLRTKIYQVSWNLTRNSIMQSQYCSVMEWIQPLSAQDNFSLPAT